MSFRKNEVQQMHLTDRLDTLTDRERRFLDKSWAKPFGDIIFPRIDEAKFEVLFCSDNGRPNSPVNVVVGSLLLKEMMGLNDEELVDSIILDPRFQYALHLTSCDEIPYSDRTPSRFRERLYRHMLETGEDLLKEEVERLGSVFAELLKIQGTLRRMDSVMVATSSKSMGRLELMYTCVCNVVKALVEAGRSDLLPEHYLDYTRENRNPYCYRLEKGEVQTRLEAMTQAALFLLEAAREAVGENEAYRLLVRMLGDQTEEGQLKAHHAISPHSLQNPSDADASFRRKAGENHKGYVANFVEECGELGAIITHYDYAINTHSDTEFGAEVIAALGPQEEKSVLITDGAYASEGNFEAAAANGIELVPTTLTAKEPPLIINDFVIEENVIKACPVGLIPKESAYNEKKQEVWAHFDRECCSCCVYQGECPAVLQKKRAVVKLSRTTIHRAAFVERLSSKEYKEYARKRNCKRSSKLYHFRPLKLSHFSEDFDSSLVFIWEYSTPSV